MSTKRNENKEIGNSANRSGTRKEIDSAQLTDLFENGLKEVYWCEKELVKTISRMMESVCSEQLFETLGEHLTETDGHAKEVEGIFSSLSKKPFALRDGAFAGILKEAEEIMDDCDDDEICDVAILAMIQKIEHYEIACYQSLIQLAEALKYPVALDRFNMILDEEIDCNEKLIDLAKNLITIRVPELENEPGFFW